MSVQDTILKTNDAAETRPESASADQKPVFKLPPGYEDEASFLSTMRQEFYDDIQFDRLNREAALEDTRFAVGDQWDDNTRQRREAARKPTLTINRIIAFIAQVIGQRRMNETTIKVVPDNGGTKQIAQLREGLMRNIQKVSRADLAYDKALEGAVTCGIGNFRIELDYSPSDVWNQEIFIRAINDHLAVVWDRTLTDPTGRDARHCFVVETMPKKTFYQNWPWATPADVVTDATLRGDLRMNGWIAIDDVRVVSYWRLCWHKRKLALFRDGTTRDITDSPDVALAQVAQRADGTPVMREAKMPYAEMYLCSGMDILDGPYKLNISRIPVFRVPGWEMSVGEWKHRWGLVRFLKDPQRLHNYWRSVIAEKLMQTPRAVWLAAKSAVMGREKDFRQSHQTDDPLLVWNDESGHKPERLAPAQMEEALLAQAEITTQDMKDVSNIHEANLGMPSNEVSGAAINARQRVSDTGTVIYHDNCNAAIEECGRTVDELIPTVYDTPRIVKVLGIDGTPDLIAINDTDAKAMMIDTGKYSVSVVTGPSYATKRVEAQQIMMSLANAMPEVLSLGADIIVEAFDLPEAQQLAERIRMSLPPEMLSAKDMTPELQQKLSAKAQSQQQQQKALIAQTIAELDKSRSEAALNNARAANFEATAEATRGKMPLEAANVQSQIDDRTLRGGLETVKVANAGG